jgi:hypothetical protein
MGIQQMFDSHLKRYFITIGDRLGILMSDCNRLIAMTEVMQL